MSSFTSVYTSLPSLYPSTFLHSPSLIPSTVLSTRHLAPPLPSHAPLTAYFCLICPHCKVDCYQRGESKAGPGSVSVIVIFNVINFNFQSFCPLPPPPPRSSTSLVLPPPPLKAYPSWEFVNSVSLCLSLSFILTPSLQTPIGYYPVSCLPQTSAAQNAIFSRPHP